MPNRQDAMALLTEYTQSLHLIRHALAVEAGMVALAARYGADRERWAITGLLHDFDYERWPDLAVHPLQGQHILRERGYPEDVIYAILSHANHLQDRYPRVNLMDKALFACDEISGFIMAVAMVRPNRSLAEVDVSAVLKKLKDKRFAANVRREDVTDGAALLGLSLDEHIAQMIAAMQPLAADLGLAGSAQG